MIDGFEWGDCMPGEVFLFSRVFVEGLDESQEAQFSISSLNPDDDQNDFCEKVKQILAALGEQFSVWEKEDFSCVFVKIPDLEWNHRKRVDVYDQHIRSLLENPANWVQSNPQIIRI